MTAILDYITANNLPCQTYLDANNSGSISTVGGNFTLANLIGNTNYDFIQTNSLLYPTVVSNGITFSGAQRLYSRNGNLFDNASSYTLLNIVSGTDYSANDNQLLHATKLTSSLPPALEYAYQTASVQQQHSRQTLFNYITQSATYINTIVNSLPYTIQSIVVNHNIKYGITNVNINQTGYVSYINKDKGTFDSSVIDNVYIGNSNTQTKPFSNVLKQLLVFIPQIAQVNIDYIMTQLLLVQLVWEYISTSSWDTINTTLWDTMLTSS